MMKKEFTMNQMEAVVGGDFWDTLYSTVSKLGNMAGIGVWYIYNDTRKTCDEGLEIAIDEGKEILKNLVD